MNLTLSDLLHPYTYTYIYKYTRQQCYTALDICTVTVCDNFAHLDIRIIICSSDYIILYKFNVFH